MVNNKCDGRLAISELDDTTSYFNILQLLKEEIYNTKIRASLAINKEVTLLYWRIGKEIVRQKVDFGWGSKVIDRFISRFTP